MTITGILLDRLARLTQAAAWARGLNPAQAAALDYLARANRFSRAPSHVADYFGTTRGTASQTLLALARKGLVAAEPSCQDRRAVSYRVTEAGRARLPGQGADAVLDDLTPAERAALDRVLEVMVRRLAVGGRSFGLCATCRYHQQGPYCGLLNLALDSDEARQLCHEHQAIA